MSCPLLRRRSSGYFPTYLEQRRALYEVRSRPSQAEQDEGDLGRWRRRRQKTWNDDQSIGFPVHWIICHLAPRLVFHYDMGRRDSRVESCCILLRARVLGKTRYCCWEGNVKEKSIDLKGPLQIVWWFCVMFVPTLKLMCWTVGVVLNCPVEYRSELSFFDLSWFLNFNEKLR